MRERGRRQHGFSSLFDRGGQHSQDEAVPVEPERVLRVVAHGLAEEGDSDCCGAHGRSGVSALVGLDDVGSEAADGGEDESIGCNLQEGMVDNTVSAAG